MLYHNFYECTIMLEQVITWLNFCICILGSVLASQPSSRPSGRPLFRVDGQNNTWTGGGRT